MEPKLSIGMKVRDRVTSFEGEITAFYDFGYRRRVCIEARDSTGKVLMEWFDEERMMEMPATA